MLDEGFGSPGALKFPLRIGQMKQVHRRVAKVLRAFAKLAAQPAVGPYEATIPAPRLTKPTLGDLHFAQSVGADQFSANRPGRVAKLSATILSQLECLLEVFPG